MRNYFRARVPVQGFVCLALLSISPYSFEAYAQQTITSATLSGRVDDSNGGAIEGAAITITDLDHNRSASTKTDSQGRYKFPYLAVGRYQLKVDREGFMTFDRELMLSVGQALDLSVKLSVKGVSASTEVTAQPPLVETARTQVAEFVSPREIETLPLNGRNYLDLALLAPGVSRTNTGSVQRFAETSAVPGTGISVASQRNLNNSFVVDGVSANDDAADLAGTFFSQEVIREFQVVTSGGIAEFGRASSGVVNIITQSGSNDFRARVYAFGRNQRFDARNPLAPTRDPLTQMQYGASVGGPLIRNRSFFFSNFEQTRRNDSNVITISPANVASINARLNQIGFRGPGIETGIVPAGYDTTNFFARVDHRLNRTNQLSVRYSLYDIGAVNSRTVGGLNSVSRGSNIDDRDQTITAGNVTTLSPRVLNEARFQFMRSRLSAPVNDEVGPAVNISGVASFGTATFSPLARNTDLYELVDSVTAERASHSIKAGVDFLYDRVAILFPGSLQGVYTFTSLANFLTGNYGSFQQAFGAPSQFQSNPNIGFFAQDEWRLNHNLTINAGLRYDAQFLPSPINTDSNNFAPRVGIAYAPGDHKTVIRAGYGIYFDRIPLRATSNALQRDGTKYLVLQFSPTQTSAPAFPNVLSSQPPDFVTKPNITRIDPDIGNASGQQASLQIERELPAGASISAGYLYLRGEHLILSRNLNVPRFAAPAGVPNLGRPDPNWGNIARFEGSGDSYYNGFVLAFNKRANSWAGVRVSYNYSKSLDNAGNFFFSTPQNNFDLRDDRGLSDNDQRHRLTVSGTLDAPRGSGKDWTARALAGWGFNYIFSYTSRLPFNIVTGTDRNFDTNFNDRPIGVARNTGSGFNFASLDLRLTRRFDFSEHARLEVIAEAFNVLNRSNFQVPNNVFGAGTTPVASLGRPTAASDPRQIQFGLRLSL